MAEPDHVDLSRRVCDAARNAQSAADRLVVATRPANALGIVCESIGRQASFMASQLAELEVLVRNKNDQMCPSQVLALQSLIHNVDGPLPNCYDVFIQVCTLHQRQLGCRHYNRRYRCRRHFRLEPASFTFMSNGADAK